MAHSCVCQASGASGACHYRRHNGLQHNALSNIVLHPCANAVCGCSSCVRPVRPDMDVHERPPKGTKRLRTCKICWNTATMASSTWHRHHGRGVCFPPPAAGGDAGAAWGSCLLSGAFLSQHTYIFWCSHAGPAEFYLAEDDLGGQQQQAPGQGVLAAAAHALGAAAASPQQSLAHSIGDLEGEAASSSSHVCCTPPAAAATSSSSRPAGLWGRTLSLLCGSLALLTISWL